MSGRSWEQLRFRSSDRKVLTGFYDCPETIISHPLMQAIQHTQLVTAGYVAFLTNDKTAPSLVQLLSGRNSILHEILSIKPEVKPINSNSPHGRSGLPPQRSRVQEPLHALDVAEANDDILLVLIRLATLAFVLLVLFPMPRTAGIHDKLSNELTQALALCNDKGLWAGFSDLLLWSTVLGGATANENSRVHFVDAWLVWEDKKARSKGDERNVDVEADLWRQTLLVCANFLWYDGFESELQKQVSLFWDSVMKRRKQAARSLYP